MILNFLRNRWFQNVPKPVLWIMGFTLTFLLVVVLSPFTQSLHSPKTIPSDKNPIIAQSIAATPRLGTNLSGISSGSTQLPFIDAFKSSRAWIPQCDRKTDPGCRGNWGTQENDQLDLDEFGWVKSLPRPEDPPEYTRVGTLMNRGVYPYPGGKYIVFYEGEGTIEYKYDAEKDVAASKPGRDIIDVTPSEKGIYLIITSTDPNKTGNYIRNIHVVPIEYENTYQTQIFNPKFLEKIKPFQAFRFMDWMDTNHSEQKEWKNRPTVKDASYGWDKGVPLEIMIEFVNRLKIHPWFNMPHQATDEYMRNFALMVKENVDPNLTIYVEYSNEVWNTSFSQFKWVRDNGPLPGGTTSAQSYGVKSAQMCDIWKGVFGEERQRVKCVMGTHSARRSAVLPILNCEKWDQAPCYKHGIDALAIAAYFGGNLGKPDNEAVVESWIDDPQIDEFERGITQLKNGSLFEDEEGNVASLKDRFEFYTDIAKEHGLELVVYEGGTHVVGTRGVQNNEKLTKFFIELIRRPEITDLYTEVLQAWQDPEGTRTLFMNFSDISSPSKWGSWGALEHVEQNNAPKYDALMNFLKGIN